MDSPVWRNLEAENIGTILTSNTMYKLCPNSHTSVSIPPCSTLIVRCTTFDMFGVPNRALLFRTYRKCRRLFNRLFFFYHYYCCFFNSHLQADDQDSIEDTLPHIQKCTKAHHNDNASLKCAIYGISTLVS